MLRESKKRYSTFRSKVLRILLFIGVTPLLVISFVSLAIVIKTRLESISELQSQAINGTSEKIERYLDQKMGAFNLVIDLNPDNISEIDLNSLRFIAKGLKESAGDVYELSFIDKYGKEIVKISDIQGIEHPPLKNVSEKIGFREAISGKNYFGPVEYTLAGPVIEMASQIENKDRRIIGVIWAEVNLNPIRKAISKIKIGKEGFVYLVDGRGNLIASSNAGLGLPGKKLGYIPQIKDLIKGNTRNDPVKEDRYVNPLGQKVFFSGRSIEGTKWFIISEWPWEDAFSVVGVMVTSFLGIILVSLVLLIFSSLFFARLVVRPVEILSQGADEISKGNLNYKIHIKTGDELEKLGERFNKMIQVLRENKKLRDEFVFIAAHELRAPVTIVKYYLSMILNGDFGEVGEEMKKPLEVSQKLNERLVKLVQDLLEVARGEAGKIEIKVSPVSITKSISEVLEEFKEKAEKKGIKLVYKGPEKEIKVKADLYKLKEVISNLVDNAIKYTINGGDIIVKNEIRGQMVVTHIKDNGVGIAKKDINKLFSKFYRVQAKELRDIEGTGLGLFICKQIIEKMNGKIWVESQLGRGSTFSFSLPLAGLG